MTTKEIYIEWELLKNNKHKYSRAQLIAQQKRLKRELKKLMRPNFEAEPIEAENIKTIFKTI